MRGGRRRGRPRARAAGCARVTSRVGLGGGHRRAERRGAGDGRATPGADRSVAARHPGAERGAEQLASHLGPAERQPVVGGRRDRPGDRAGRRAPHLRRLELRMVLLQVPAGLAVPDGGRRSRPYLAYLYVTGGWRHPTGAVSVRLRRSGAGAVRAGDDRPRCSAVGVRRRHRRRSPTASRCGCSIARRRAGAPSWSRPRTRSIYYAHTTNLDISYCFWLILALYARDRRAAAGRGGRRDSLPLGGARRRRGDGAVDQGAGLRVPAAAAVHGAGGARAARPAACACSGRRRRWVMCGGGRGDAAGWPTTRIVNPLGFVGRIAYLLGHPLAAGRGAPGAGRVRALEGRQGVALRRPSVGRPRQLARLAAAGAGRRSARWRCGGGRAPRCGCWCRPWSLYYLSLRGLELITAALPAAGHRGGADPGRGAAGLAARRARAARRRAGRSAALLAAVAALSLARALELDWLLRTDSRYRAEAWMAEHLPPGARAEIYQKPAFLPRFRGGVHGDASCRSASARARAWRRGDRMRSSPARPRARASRTAGRRTGARPATCCRPQPAAVELARRPGAAARLPYRVGGRLPPAAAPAPQPHHQPGTRDHRSMSANPEQRAVAAALRAGRVHHLRRARASCRTSAAGRAAADLAGVRALSDHPQRAPAGARHRALRRLRHGEPAAAVTRRRSRTRTPPIRTTSSRRRSASPTRTACSACCRPAAACSRSAAPAASCWWRRASAASRCRASRCRRGRRATRATTLRARREDRHARGAWRCRPESYDAVVMADVIEHLTDPRATLRADPPHAAARRPPAAADARRRQR